MTLRQRQPREVDDAWLAIVRKMPCTVCRRPGPSDPAHLRTAAPQYGKPPTGMGEKPSDRWVLPLCRTHHDEQHRGNELAFWLRYGIPDPFAEAMKLYASRPVPTRPTQPRIKRSKLRKPKGASAGRFLQRADPWPKQTRKIPSRRLRAQ